MVHFDALPIGELKRTVTPHEISPFAESSERGRIAFADWSR